MIVRAPRVDECDYLTELCLRSKAHWGYDETFMQACRDELTISAALLEANFCRVAELQNPVGFVEVECSNGTWSLNKLFVDPDAMGCGAGRKLLEEASSFAAKNGASHLTIDADPDAVPFYCRFGAVTVGQVPSGSIEGRMLPRLSLPVSD